MYFSIFSVFSKQRILLPRKLIEYEKGREQLTLSMSKDIRHLRPTTLHGVVYPRWKNSHVFQYLRLGSILFWVSGLAQSKKSGPSTLDF